MPSPGLRAGSWHRALAAAAANGESVLSDPYPQNVVLLTQQTASSLQSIRIPVHSVLSAPGETKPIAKCLLTLKTF